MRHTMDNELSIKSPYRCSKYISAFFERPIHFGSQTYTKVKLCSCGRWYDQSLANGVVSLSCTAARVRCREFGQFAYAQP